MGLKEWKKGISKKIEKYQKYGDNIILCFTLFLISSFIYMSGLIIYDLLRKYIDNFYLYLLILLIIVIGFLFYVITNRDSEKFWIYVLIPLLYFYIFITYTNNNHIYTKIRLIIAMIILFIYHISLSYKQNQKLNLVTKNLKIILITLSLLLLGTAFIGGLVNEEKVKLELGLNNCSNSSEKYGSAEIKCGTFNDKAIVGAKVLCELKNIELNNISGFFNFTIQNKFYLDQSFNNTISFTTPANVSYAYVEINGIHNGKEVCLSSGYPWRFATYEEYKQNKKDFITFFIGLIGFILISAPIVYKKLEEMFSSN